MPTMILDFAHLTRNRIVVSRAIPDLMIDACTVRSVVMNTMLTCIGCFCCCNVTDPRRTG